MVANDNSRAVPGRRRFSKAGRFDHASILLHWLTVLLIAGQFTSAWWMGRAGADAPLVLAVHRSTGSLTLLVVLMRLAWRHVFADLPPFPESMPVWQRRAAQANEWALYAFLLLQPVTGLGDTLFRGHPFILFGVVVPALISADKPVYHWLHKAHEISAWTLAALIGLHASAALFHGVILRDGVLQRMFPWTAKAIQTKGR